MHQKMQDEKVEKAKKKKIFADLVKNNFQPRVDPNKALEMKKNIQKLRSKTTNV